MTLPVITDTYLKIQRVKFQNPQCDQIIENSRIKDNKIIPVIAMNTIHD